jgi:hypothetical protein
VPRGPRNGHVPIRPVTSHINCDEGLIAQGCVRRRDWRNVTSGVRPNPHAVLTPLPLYVGHLHGAGERARPRSLTRDCWPSILPVRCQVRLSRSRRRVSAAVGGRGDPQGWFVRWVAVGDCGPADVLMRVGVLGLFWSEGDLTVKAIIGTGHVTPSRVGLLGGAQKTRRGTRRVPVRSVFVAAHSELGTWQWQLPGGRAEVHVGRICAGPYQRARRQGRADLCEASTKAAGEPSSGARPDRVGPGLVRGAWFRVEAG